MTAYGEILALSVVDREANPVRDWPKHAEAEPRASAVINMSLRALKGRGSPRAAAKRSVDASTPEA